MIKIIKFALLLIEYPLYLLICGSKQKQIDWKNQQLSKNGAGKVCIDIDFSSASTTYKYIVGNPAKAKVKFKTFNDFMVMRGLK